MTDSKPVSETQLSVRMPKDMRERLEEVAENLDRPAGWIIRTILKTYLDRMEQR